ncbi:transporter substrate-binding domain-containing protein [Pelomonas sp. KK5]|uniref:ATP-binding protein n=1 Tax=Pelomonas sp. KK5 TaxID=1855730 RepID=UPI00097BA95B|nr:transporter substrate-binding domain-containing protein [Pelomonas sp. KK5]
MARARFLALLFCLTGLLLALPLRAQDGIELSAEEKAWIAAHPLVRVATSRSYGPFTFVDESGAVRGLSVDYIERLRRLTGLHIELAPPAPFAESMQALKDGRVDLIMSVRDTAERREFLSFTRPYITVPAVLLRRREDGVRTAPAAGDLQPGEKVSVSQGYAVQPFLADRFPDNPRTIEADDRSLLRRLAGGEISAGVMDMAGATYLMRTEGIGNVRVVGDIGFAYDLAIGYRRDWPLLGRILQKGLDQIDADERQAIADRWIPLDHGGGAFSRRAVIGGSVVLALGLLGLLAMAGWNRTLRREVVARTEQLQHELAERRRLQDADHARAMAELANRSKAEFMSQASHELRTPLNAVLGFAQLLAVDGERPLDETQRQRVARIEEAARHLLLLIEDMMSFSRLESGTLVVEAKPIDAIPLLRRCVELAMPAAADAGLTLVFEPPPNLPLVLADPLRLEQVMHNLVSNAIKYNRAGGWVRVRAWTRGPEEFCIEVADSGMGLSIEQQAQLFQPFNRLGRSALEGTGIGLVICKQLMERMGGRIGVSSEAGQGSRFTLELRVAPATGATP